MIHEGQIVLFSLLVGSGHGKYMISDRIVLK
jgi:hypothetical protein